LIDWQRRRVNKRKTSKKQTIVAISGKMLENLNKMPMMTFHSVRAHNVKQLASRIFHQRPFISAPNGLLGVCGVKEQIPYEFFWYYWLISWMQPELEIKVQLGK
jgi:hypothetical protein